MTAQLIDRIRRSFVRFRSRFVQAPQSMYTVAQPIRQVRSSILVEPEHELMVAEEATILLPARVILYNDEVHTFDEVILQIIKATGCSTGEAEALTFEVDNRGLACVFEGDMSHCIGVSSILEEIALHTSIEM